MSLEIVKFAELLEAFVDVRSRIIDPREAARLVIEHRALNRKRFGWPEVSPTLARDLVIALLACADVVHVRPEPRRPMSREAFLERFSEPHPVATSRGPRAPDGPGDACTCGACAWCDRLDRAPDSEPDPFVRDAAPDGSWREVSLRSPKR